jgi:pimeloyl-ACP methyl ester carboxylesterase
LSDKPDGPTGRGKAEDVIEMIDHLKIQKARFHGYSMGGAIVGRLLAMIPERMITASFGGSGLVEVDPEMRAKVPADKQGTDPQEAEALRTLRIRRAMDLDGKSHNTAIMAGYIPDLYITSLVNFINANDPKK